ncbi:MAG: N-acetylneuraminate synthase family protein [Sedimenticola sp.]
MQSSPEFEIAGRKIGPDHPPLLIAEIGINHGGSLTVAKEMVDAAVAAGAEVIKHQTHVVEDEMSKAARSVIPGNADISIYDIMASCALDEEAETELQRYVQSRGAIFLSTPFSRAAAERLERMQVPAYKIGSGECNNYPLIRHIAGFGKPVILSTGMNSIEQIGGAVEILRAGNIPYALLHCTNIYPTPHHLVRLGAISELQEAFPDAVVGLSDHTLDNYACLGAVALGASILERHFTDSKEREGPDIICSMDGAEMARLIEGSRILWQARGGTKGAVAEEQPTIDFAFASVVTIRPVKVGERFSEENIWVKRPGLGGIHASRFEGIVGKRCLRDLEEDVQLHWEDVEGGDQ